MSPRTPRNAQDFVTVNTLEGRSLPCRLIPASYEIEATDEVGEVTTTRFVVAASDPAGHDITLRLP